MLAAVLPLRVMPQTAVKHRCTSTRGCEGERTRGKAVSKTTSARPRESSHVLEKVERSASRSVLKWFGVPRRKVISRVYVKRIIFGI